jgi:hypothetical protein
MSDHDRPPHPGEPTLNSEPKDGDHQSAPTPKEPEPDVDVEVPKYQYLTEGFDPDLIKKR